MELIYNSYTNSTVQFWNCLAIRTPSAFGAFCSFALPFAMHTFFQRVDLAAYRQQVAQVAAQLKENPPPRAPTPPPRRSVGRPKRKLLAEEVLVAAAAADALELPEHKRGTYTRWFNSPYINDILHAYALSGGSARRAVASLQERAPDSRFERLSHSTVASWFENGKLKAQQQHELDEGRAAATSTGVCPAMQAAPGAEDAICDILLKMRQAGTPLNSCIIRCVMLAVLEERHPAVLQQLTLSQQYISTWVRRTPRLQFRWRARTTAASKLPNDWEEQGIQMSMRIGAAMQLHRVSHLGNTLGTRQPHMFLTYSSRFPPSSCAFLWIPACFF
jgi:hypothetical protein